MRNPIETPPAELRQLIPALAPQIEELERLRVEEATARQEVAEAEAAAETAEQTDRQALADHARGKRKQEPKPTAPKARENLARAETKAAAMEQAAADAQVELETAIEGHREECVELLDTEHDRLQEEVRSALRELREREAERVRVAALRGWLHRPRQFAPTKFGGRVDVRQRNGEPYSLAPLLSEIETALAAEEQVAEAPEAEGVPA